MTQHIEAMKQARRFLMNSRECDARTDALEAIDQAIAEAEKQEQGEPVAWISVKDELPKAVRGVSYKASLTDTVLVRHADRPDYPITAHAVVGEGLGAGIAIPTEGASEHPEIAWYSASSDLNNPFGLKNQDYERFLPKIFGTKITHWMSIPNTHPYVPTERQPKRNVATPREWVGLDNDDWIRIYNYADKCVGRGAELAEEILKEKNT